MKFFTWMGKEEPQTAKEDLRIEVYEKIPGMLGSSLIAIYPNWRAAQNWASGDLLMADVVDSMLCEDSSGQEYYRVVIRQ